MERVKCTFSGCPLDYNDKKKILRHFREKHEVQTGDESLMCHNPIRALARDRYQFVNTFALDRHDREQHRGCVRPEVAAAREYSGCEYFWNPDVNNGAAQREDARIPAHFHVGDRVA